MKALCQCAKIYNTTFINSKFIIQHKTIIRFGLIVFLFKSLNAFNSSAARKNLITNNKFFINSFVAEVPII